MPGANEVRAGGAFVELYARDGALRKGLDAAAERVKGLGAAIASVGVKTAGLAAVAATPLAILAGQFKDSGAALYQMSQRTGASTEALSELGFAAAQTGADMATVENALAELRKKVGEGLGDAAFAKLSPDKQLEAFADAIKAIPDPAERAKAAVENLADNGKKLLPLLQMGGSGIRQLREEAQRLGLSVGTEQAKQANEFQLSWNRVTATLGAAGNAIGGALAPVLTDLLGTVLEYSVAAGRWIRDNKELVVTIGKVIAVVGLVGVGLAAVGAAVYVVGAAIGALSTAIGIVGTLATTVFAAAKLSVLALLSPIGLVVAGIAGLTAAWLATSEGGKQAAGETGKAWSAMGHNFTAGWGAILDRIKSGDLAGALAVVVAKMKSLWADLLLGMAGTWNAFAEGIARSVKGNPGIFGAGAGAGIGAIAGSVVPGVGTLAGAAIGGAIGFFGGRQNADTNAAAAQRLAGGASFDLAALREASEAARQALDEAIAAPIQRATEAARKAGSGTQDAALSLMLPGGSRGGFDASRAAAQFGLSDQVSKLIDLSRSQDEKLKSIDENVKAATQIR